MKSFSKLRTLVCGAATVWAATQVSAEVLFSDNLDATNGADRWKVFTGYYQGGATNDFSLQWGVDYSQLQFPYYASSAAAPELRAIPPSPNSHGTTRGLLVNVNKSVNDDATVRESFGVSLYPVGQSFSGDFVLRFDLFLNYDGYAGTYGDTTQFATYGVNFAGDKVNWTSRELDPKFTAGPGSQTSDGLWFIHSNDGFALRNFRALQGNPAGGAVLARTIPAASDVNGDSIFPDRDGDGFSDNQIPTGGPFSGDFAPYVQRIFPQPPAELRGTAGKAWIPVEVSQYRDVITWRMNGAIVASYTNTTHYTAGNIMLGYADLFNRVANFGDYTWALFDNVRVERIRTVIVDTEDNGSTQDDGKTSLLEALRQLDDNDVIAFNIPGPGPHYIATPAGGYPAVTNKYITIDGYTQPGASPNTAGVHSTNHAAIQIVLDSRNGAATSLAAYATNGYSATQSAILPVFGAQHFTLRGISLLSVPGSNTVAAPFIYGVAAIKDASDLRIQGCWFGVDPTNLTSAGVSGGRSALAAFPRDATTFPSGIIFGTDSDGLNDAAEPNVVCGQGLALDLQIPNVRVAGNFFNFLPDGSVFDPGLTEGDAGAIPTYQFYRNSAGDNSLIGTDGDLINDAGEANFIGPVGAGQFVEFAGPVTNAVVAGNYVGMGPAGVPYVNQVPAAFVAYPASASLRIGSDFRADPAAPNQEAFVKADLLSFNHLANLRLPALAPRNTGTNAVNHAWVIFSGNELLNNFGSFPLDPASGVDPFRYYTGLLDPTSAVTTPLVSTNSTLNHLQGTLPPLDANAIVTSKRISIWLADPSGLSHMSPAYTNGWIQTAVYLGEFEDNGVADQNPDPDAFDVDLSGYPLTLDDVPRTFVVVEYGLADGRRTTVQFSNTVGLYLGPGRTIRFSTPFFSDDGQSLNLFWTGGTPPYTVQTAPAPGGPWTDVITLLDQTYAVPATDSNAMFRIVTQ